MIVLGSVLMFLLITGCFWFAGYLFKDGVNYCDR